jgi:hypothetical protein
LNEASGETDFPGEPSRPARAEVHLAVQHTKTSG